MSEIAYREIIERLKKPNVSREDVNNIKMQVAAKYGLKKSPSNSKFRKFVSRRL